jgi:hypothetical protein
MGVVHSGAQFGALFGSEVPRLVLDRSGSTSGLLRTGGEGLVTRRELTWAMPEAMKEPSVVPNCAYLGATLGRMGIAEH